MCLHVGACAQVLNSQGSRLLMDIFFSSPAFLRRTALSPSSLRRAIPPPTLQHQAAGHHRQFAITPLTTTIEQHVEAWPELDGISGGGGGSFLSRLGSVNSATKSDSRNGSGLMKKDANTQRKVLVRHQGGLHGT